MMFTVNESQRTALELLGEELQCPACGKLLDKACTTRCAHSFCRACIDECLAGNSECPRADCSIPMLPGEIAPNPFLQQLVCHYQTMTTALANLDKRREKEQQMDGRNASSKNAEVSELDPAETATLGEKGDREEGGNEDCATMMEENGDCSGKGEAKTVEETDLCSSEAATLEEAPTIEEISSSDADAPMAKEDDGISGKRISEAHLGTVEATLPGESTINSTMASEAIEATLDSNIDEISSTSNKEDPTNDLTTLTSMEIHDAPTEEAEPGTQAIERAQSLLESCRSEAGISTEGKDVHPKETERKSLILLVSSDTLKSLSEEEKGVVEEMGGIIRSNINELETDSWTHTITHTIIQESSSQDDSSMQDCSPYHVFAKTPKYVFGVLQGSWILLPGWLKDSIANRRWAKEEAYEVHTESGVEKQFRVARQLEQPTPFDDFNYVLAMQHSKSREIARFELELVVAHFASSRKPNSEIKDLSYFVEPRNYKGVDLFKQRRELGLSFSSLGLEEIDQEPFSDPKKIVIIVANHVNSVNDAIHWDTCEYCQRLQVLVEQFPNSIVVDCVWVYRLPFQTLPSKKFFKHSFFAPSHVSKLVGSAIPAEIRSKYKLRAKK